MRAPPRTTSAKASAEATTAEGERAKALLADYQQERARRQRAAYDEARQLGTAPTLSGRIREQPVHVIGVLVIVLVLLGITVLPFVTLG